MIILNSFTVRTAKEILRDPLSLLFGIGFPVILLILLTAIGKNVPNPLFELEKLTPGIAVFGLSFMSLFSAQLIAKDRSSSLLARLFTTPMTSVRFITGYTLPLLPMALMQSIVCYITAVLLGMKITISILPALLLTIPAAIIFIGIGLLCGSLFSEKTVTGICGALLTNLSAWLSGTWFDLDLVGGIFKNIARVLPFASSVDIGKAALSGTYSAIFPPIWLVLGYGTAIALLAIIIFKGKMKLH